jgi:uncharacterized protein YqfB (UPF0267 family)
MKGIMFNTKYGLEQAVLNGTKTRTWRADKEPRYKIGEIVAIKQCYKNVCYYFCEQNNRKYIDYIELYSHQKGWQNKMFVKNELMPHKIKITGIKQCRLQDINDLECCAEGIFLYKGDFFKGYTFNGCDGYYSTPQEPFAKLINKLNGKDYWESNPLGYAYELELIK